MQFFWRKKQGFDFVGTIFMQPGKILWFFTGFSVVVNFVLSYFHYSLTIAWLTFFWTPCWSKHSLLQFIFSVLMGRYFAFYWLILNITITYAAALACHLSPALSIPTPVPLSISPSLSLLFFSLFVCLFVHCLRDDARTVGWIYVRYHFHSFVCLKVLISYFFLVWGVWFKKCSRAVFRTI